MRYGAALALTVGLACTAACTQGGPPPELSGLWSSGPAACEAGVGVRFESGVVAAHYAGGGVVPLLNTPDYDVERRGARVRVRILYKLPAPAGGASSPGANGVLVVERGDDGWLNAVTHRLQDARTGSARITIGPDSVVSAFHLRRCGPGAWIAGLRGRG